MKTLLTEYRADFKQSLLDFIWLKWCQAGVMGDADQESNVVIDPEVLLAFTSEMARWDARVFDEVMDWLLVNGRWINIQRFSTILTRDGIGNLAVVGAIASRMSAETKTPKWDGLAHRMLNHKYDSPQALFKYLESQPGLSSSKPALEFEKYGLIRDAIQARHMTRPVNMKSASCLAFKCRALFGVGNSADIMTYLLTRGGGHPRYIASVLGCNHMRTQEYLINLRDAGLASMRPVGKTKEYWIDQEQWKPLLNDPQNLPHWVDWRSLARGLTTLWRALLEIDENRADEYIISSKVRVAMQNAIDDLHSTNLGLNLEPDKGYVAESYLPIFEKNMQQIREVLAKF